MRQGKKTTARKVCYDAFSQLDKPLDTFMLALKNVSPRVELISKRIGGAHYQIPKDVAPERGLTLAMRWLIQASQGKKGAPMAKHLAQELKGASEEQGAAIKKKQDTHKMAEANKAFAHFLR